MRNLRSWLAALIALVFATTMGAASAQNVKSFDLLNVSLTGSTVSAEFKNSTTATRRSTPLAQGDRDGGTVTFSNVGVKADGVTVSASNVFLQDSNTKLVVTSLSPGQEVQVGRDHGDRQRRDRRGPVCAVHRMAGFGLDRIGFFAQPGVLSGERQPSTGIDAGCKLAFSSLPPSLVRSGHVGRRVSNGGVNGQRTARTTRRSPASGGNGDACVQRRLLAFTEPAASRVVGRCFVQRVDTERACDGNDLQRLQASTTTAGIASTSVATLKVFDEEARMHGCRHRRAEPARFRQRDLRRVRRRRRAR
jgi:hypothetical protein